MSTAAICPIVGTTTNVLPPNHPAYDANKPGLVCPVTNASTDHHHNLHAHPHPNNAPMTNDAQSCPALKNANNNASITDATCPVVGPVSAYLPADHPSTEGADEAAVCPVTNATLAHHKSKVHEHPKVVNEAAVCPVAHRSISNA